MSYFKFYAKDKNKNCISFAAVSCLSSKAAAKAIFSIKLILSSLQFGLYISFSARSHYIGCLSYDDTNLSVT